MAKGVEKDFSGKLDLNRLKPSLGKQQAYYYGGLLLLVVIGYLLIASGLGIVFAALFPPAHPIVTGLVVFIIFLGLNPLQQRWKKSIDTLFIENKKTDREMVEALNRSILRASGTAEIISAFSKIVTDKFSPRSIYFFLLDPSGEYFLPVSGDSARLPSDLVFSRLGSRSEFFDSFNHALHLKIPMKIMGFPPEDNARLALLGCEWLVPLLGRSGLRGWAALGTGVGGSFSSQDMILMEELASNAGEALEKAAALVVMDNRIREMNLLTRIAQGVNITLSQDDMLELVFTQATQIIPADDFEVYLQDEEKQIIRAEFIVEENERRLEKERQPSIGSQPLEMEVFHQRRVLLTADYEQESRQRGILAGKEVKAWLGVPLNAGADTIGVVCLGRRTTNAPFSQNQAALLQAIADQTAGAITKLRLLRETERRARQLSTLNDMTRQLTSTLEQEPLLRNILQSATDMLDCEAGSLLLMDDQTDELVFRVTVGPVAGDLLNKRMPSGAGLVGKAAKSKGPVIENNVHQSPDWFKKTDQMTGFITKSALVVPLLVKETSIGVIEVVNKKDGSLFSKDDENLLSAFAAQAAVALENARLFTLTDQALEERVEELSVMQRIDRELNTSLDMTKAMQISLEWAMRQSSAAAGLIGSLYENRLKVIASQGFSTELETFPEGSIPLASPQYQQAIADGTPRRVAASGDGVQMFLTESLSQVIIPIRRESGAIGMIILEGLIFDPPSTEVMDFLQRLADHASIAISNAQLYTAVQSANVAKSEFVSFVSHELKNPMTSIKGYTELLAAGAVGQVNEAQANFLATIRSNIERMNILVSDLNDMSKIEAGRLRLEYKSFTTLEVVEEVMRSTRRQVEEKNQHLTQSIPAGLPNIWADRTRVAQVVVNLVSNAIKYTPQGGEIVINAECCDNQWDPDGAPRVIHVAVKDNGIGISEEDQKKIFQKFFRSEDPRTREVPGTGLGLNITRSLVEMQGGRIWFESVYSKGTTFHFTVPVVS